MPVKRLAVATAALRLALGTHPRAPRVDVDVDVAIVSDRGCDHLRLYVPVPIGRRYPLGLLVVQNGDAPEPPNTDPVHGFEFDGSTQLKYVDFSETLKALLR